MVWNLTKPKPNKKLTLQDFKVGDRVRVLEDTQPVWREPTIPAGTKLEVVRAGWAWVNLKDSQQNSFCFYDLATAVTYAVFGTAAKRTLDNLEKVE